MVRVGHRASEDFNRLGAIDLATRVACLGPVPAAVG